MICCNERVVYICAWETPGSSGGFEWRWHAAEAQAIENYMLPDATMDGTRFARFAYPLPWGMSDEEITNTLEWEFDHGSFDFALWPEDFAPHTEVKLTRLMEPTGEAYAHQAGYAVEVEAR